MKTSRLIFFLLMALALLRCEKPESPEKSYFVKYFGDEGQQTGVDVEVNPDGTFILFGTTELVTNQPSDNSQFYIVKADEFGNVIWEHTYGGPLDEEAKDVEIVSNGDIVIVGNSYVSPASRDILLMTLNPDGTKKDSVLLNYKQNGTGPDADEDVTTVSETNDGFVVAGSTDNLHAPGVVQREALIVRVYADLSPYAATWQDPPSYSQSTETVTTKIVQLPTGGFYGFGYSTFSVSEGDKNDFDFLVFSLNSDGTSNAGIRTMGTTGVDEKLGSVAIVPAALGDGYFLSGIVTDLSGNDDIYVAKLKQDPIADSIDIAPKSLGLSLLKLTNEHVSATSSLSSSYLVLSNEASSGSNNLLLTKVAVDGQVVFQTPIIYGGQGDDFVGSVRELPDGKILIIGTMSIGQVGGETKMVLMKVNGNGQFAE